MRDISCAHKTIESYINKQGNINPTIKILLNDYSTNYTGISVFPVERCYYQICNILCALNIVDGQSQ